MDGVHTQGRTITEARRRVREALSLTVGDEAAEAAHFVDDVKLPSEVKAKLAEYRKLKKTAEAVILSTVVEG